MNREIVSPRPCPQFGQRQFGHQALLSATILWALALRLGFADGPQDNIPDKVRRIPKEGIVLQKDKRDQMEHELRILSKAIQTLRQKKDERTTELLPDIEIFERAVGDALQYQEFFDTKEISVAIELLLEGRHRADQLAAGKAPWTEDHGLVVRGYVSKIDGSVQPYGLVVPPSYSHQGSAKFRVDLWFHGRGETLSELNFLQQRRKQVGTFAPADTIVLHPYGRYSNAFKFAGEVDVLEALASVQRRYRVDPDRITSRGFSMGGAAAWQFAVHYPDRWAAANPGAGFSETPEFLRTFQQETLNPTWFERKLWHWYDCTDWALNLYHCPTVAYSGELDSQKQAADIMQVAMSKEGLDLVHIVGPNTKHAYHPGARDDVDQRMASIVSRGREAVPNSIRFVTYTLRYNRMSWVTIDALGEHWEKARVDADLSRDAIELNTQNVTALTLSFPPGYAPLDLRKPVEIRIAGQKLTAPSPKSDRSWSASLALTDGRWALGTRPDGLRKQHALQGPIDDAFMDSFIFVRPTGTSPNTLVNEWTKSEFDRAVEHWRRHFRGHARVKDDSQVTEQDIAGANLVLWGDASSNALLNRIAGQLPITMDRNQVVVGDRKFDATQHVPILIYPNPLNPTRYVVLNSSFTFREYAYLNNARQVPMLPDWAIVDVRTAPNSIWPGKVADADFFDESWKIKSKRGG